MQCGTWGEISQVSINFNFITEIDIYRRDLLRDYRTPKETKAKKFTDCAVLHPNCTFPQKSVRVKKRNGAQVKQNETIVENVEATEESPTEIPDVVAKYVKNV